MMTGAILGGSSVQQAAKLQMIIMFMITASTTLASIFVTIAAVIISVDSEHRVRSERIVKNTTGVGFGWVWTLIWNKKWGQGEATHAEQNNGRGERTRLLA